MGYNSIQCGYCGGSCVVTSEAVERYDPDLVDQVNCPRCAGKGTIGWGHSVCSYCKGDTIVTRQKYEDFNQETTVSKQVEQQLIGRGYHCILLDGDKLRAGLIDFGFSVLVPLITPTEAMQAQIRKRFDAESYAEVYVQCLLDTHVNSADQSCKAHSNSSNLLNKSTL